MFGPKIGMHVWRISVLALWFGCGCLQARVVQDSRGVAVEMVDQPQRVVTLSDGFVEGVMTVFGVADRIVGVGSYAVQREWAYSFESSDGSTYAYTGGINPVALLNPQFADLPLLANGPAIHFENLAALRPDLVILRLGSCNFRFDDAHVQRTIRLLERLGLPLIVLHGPFFSGTADAAAMTREIDILAAVFDCPDRATQLKRVIEDAVGEIMRRTDQIPARDRQRVLILGLSPSARKSGGAGQVFGTDTMESFFVEQLAHGRNAFSHPGYFKTLSAEQLLSLDPDVIVLSTAAGYHPARELLDAPYTSVLSGLRAVRENRVAALPWTPCNCEKRLEYPIDVLIIAATTYPDRFADLSLDRWICNFYRQLYGVDEATAERLLSGQWLDWTRGVAAE